MLFVIYYFLFLETVSAPPARSARPATQTPATVPVFGLAEDALFAAFDELLAALEVSAAELVEPATEDVSAELVEDTAASEDVTELSEEPVSDDASDDDTDEVTSLSETSEELGALSFSSFSSAALSTS